MPEFGFSLHIFFVQLCKKCVCGENKLGLSSIKSSFALGCP